MYAKRGPAGVRRQFSLALTGLFILAMAYTLHFAASLLIPVAIAIFIGITFSPLISYLARWHIPRGLSAGLFVSAMVAVMMLAVLVLAEPAEKWLNDAPRTIRELQSEVLSAKGPLTNIQEFANEVNELATVKGKKPAQQVVMQKPGVLENMLGGLPTVLGGAGIVIFLSFFLLASGDSALRSITRCGRTWSERRRIVASARQIQSDISQYLVTVMIINWALGAVVAVAMYILEVPNPLLWGAMAAVFNFVPYIGALASACVLAFVGLTTFSTLTDALMVPGVFLVLTILEGQLITPTVLGRRMALSPTVVFLSVIAWGWLWGIAGALMAVPIITSLKVFCEHFPSLRHLGPFLRGSRQPVVHHHEDEPQVAVQAH